MSRKTQWDALKKLGFSDKACAVVMGHAMAESGCECNRVQGDFSADRARSKAYTAQVDAGQISEHDFVFRGPGGGGYGWLQWTFPSRKKGLYDTARRLGVSVGSEAAAIECFRSEIREAEYAPVWNALKGDGSIREMSDVFMRRFERPANQSESACAYRAKLCEDMYRAFAGNAPEASQVDVPDAPYWPPRTLCLDMKGADVRMLQAILGARGYGCGEIDGIFGARTRSMTVAFQTDHGLDADGIAGEKTWNALLER